MPVSLKTFVIASLTILFALGSSTYLICQVNKSVISEFLEGSVIPAMGQSVNWEWFVAKSSASDLYVIERTFAHTDDALAELVNNRLSGQVDSIYLVKVGTHTREFQSTNCRDCYSSIHTVNTSEGNQLEIRFVARGAGFMAYPASSSILLAVLLAGTAAMAQTFWRSRSSSSAITDSPKAPEMTPTELAARADKNKATGNTDKATVLSDDGLGAPADLWLFMAQRIGDKHERNEFLEATQRSPIDFDIKKFERYAFHSEGAWDQGTLKLYELALSTGVDYDRFDHLAPLVSLILSHGHCQTVAQAIQAIEHNPIVSFGHKARRREIGFFLGVPGDFDARENPTETTTGLTLTLAPAPFTSLAILLSLRSSGLDGLWWLADPDTAAEYTKIFNEMRKCFGGRKSDSENWTEKGLFEVKNDLASCKSNFKEGLRKHGLSAYHADTLWNLLRISRVDGGILCGIDGSRVNANAYLDKLKANKNAQWSAFLANQVKRLHEIS
jgi:hypothetical protein